MLQNHLQSPLETLTESIINIAQTDGDFATAIPALSLHRRHAPSEPVHCIYQMGLGVVAQGEKQIMLAGKPTFYGQGESLLTTLDLPVVSHVTRATEEVPFLGLMLTLDPALIVQLAATMPALRPVKEVPSTPLSVQVIDIGVMQALTRLVRLLGEPNLIETVAPLIQQEIVIRLLTGHYSDQLRQLATTGSPGQQISKVVAWLKQNYTQTVSMGALAAKAFMSPSTFRQHFRTATGMSPLQFQKKLRLQQARQQMLNNQLDANSAATRAGYESATQFSREYRREFGDSPLRDIRRLRLDNEK